MSRMKTKELNELWHIIGFNMKNEMQSGKYPAISGLTQLEMGILQAIEMNPNNMLKNICDTLGLPKSTLTSAISRLESKNYIKKKSHPQDKRSYGLELLDLGVQAQKEHIEIENTVFNNGLKHLNETEIDQLIAILSKALKD